MKKVRITAVARTRYDNLIKLYENPLENECSIAIGNTFVSYDGRMPEKFCPTAWECIGRYVEALSRGDGNFFDGWMKNPFSAVISCSDGCRPVSFYIEATDE